MALTRKEAYTILELPIDEKLNRIRTNYKRLASKWLPGKHNRSADTKKKFINITKAYCLLTAEIPEEQANRTMKLNEMLHLFQQTVTGKSSATANGYGSSDEGDDEDDCLDACERQLIKTKPIESRNELITDEEKEKHRAEKRRAKKKRRREKKKLEKLEQQPKENGNTSQNKIKDFSDSKGERKSKNSDKILVPDTTDDEADFDPSSAFFTNIVNKKKLNVNISEQSQLCNTDHSKDRPLLQSHSANSEDDIEELDTVVLRSRKLAIRGNEMAQMGHYAAAIDLFTEAIRLDPSDFRFFGNRSYCYERIQQYDKALKDAEKSISISSNWPKGYFRKGRALAGQKQYSKAEEAFLQVVHLDKHCEDAKQELVRVRTHQITEMGFTKLQSEAAIIRYGTVQTALDSLLAGIVTDNLNDGFGSEKEFSVSNMNDNITINSSCSSPMDTKME